MAGAPGRHARPGLCRAAGSVTAPEFGQEYHDDHRSPDSRSTVIRGLSLRVGPWFRVKSLQVSGPPAAAYTQAQAGRTGSPRNGISAPSPGQ